MIPKIPSSVLKKSEGELVGEAPVLGFPPGEWPELVIVQTESLKFGDVNNVYCKSRSLVHWDGWDMIEVQYVAAGLPPLRIVNT